MDTRRREKLAPLDPDRFLRWVWMRGPRDKGTRPLTVEDVWFEFAGADPELPKESVRRTYVRLAARARRNQRLGLDPLEGLA